ncbi:MAG: hypothetical protein AB7I27_16470 [Bacteriovoracaceae bacterium]
MKIIKLIFLLSLGSLSYLAFANPPQDSKGFCKIMMPGYQDNVGQYCPGSRFAVAYKGYLVDGLCYASLMDAIQVMRETRACEKLDFIGDFKILYPGYMDYNRNYCPGGRFTVAYKGYMVSTHDCYKKLDDAMDFMESVGH